MNEVKEDRKEARDIFELIDKQFKELPFHKRFQKLENLISDDVSDALTDLTEEEINIVAIYKGLTRYFGELHILDYIIDKKLSLMRSRDRLGRQEYLQGLKDTRELIIPEPIPHKTEDEKTQVQKEKLGFLKKIFARRDRR